MPWRSRREYKIVHSASYTINLKKERVNIIRIGSFIDEDDCRLQIGDCKDSTRFTTGDHERLVRIRNSRC